MNKRIITNTTAVTLLLLAAPLAAHPIHDELATFTSGILHPLTNWMHILSVIVIGLWLNQRRGKMETIDLAGCSAIGSLLLLNTYVHGISITALTWNYLAGFSTSTILLLFFGISVSAFIRTAMSPTLYKVKSQQDYT